MSTGQEIVEPTSIDAGPAHDVVEGISRTPRQLAFRRFTRNWLAVAGAVVLVAMILIAYVLPLLVHLEPNAISLLQSRKPPSPGHLLGTDLTGRDVWARLVYGGRTSLGIGLSAGILAVGLGSLLGATAGTVGGWTDIVIMRASDVFQSFPSTVVVIVIAGIFGPSVPMLIIAIGAFQWPGSARLVRSVVLTMREREFIQASRAVGASRWWLIRKHLLPAALSQIVVVFTLDVAVCILQESTLSFLGLGVPPPNPSWGSMLNAAQSVTVISSMPWLWVPPGLAIALTVLCVNFVGDGLRDAVDPRQR